MPESNRCPSCGSPTPAEADSCPSCNFPLRPVQGAPSAAPAAREPEVRIERPLPRRPRRPAPMPPQSLTLWLVFAGIAAAFVVYTAFQMTLERKTAQPQVPGASTEDQKHIDELRALIARDSTNVDARVSLANHLYDTANWNDAIVHYRAAIRMDSTRATAIVDLGVCYYNLGFIDEARRHFLLGLARDPNNAVALFNLGIVAERQNDLESALRWYHDAVRTHPPENMMEPLTAAVTRVQKALGRTPPPLPGMPGGTPETMPPGGAPPAGR